ncbi:LacI family DNA-binding transcriptional regulator [Herpetosiphon sp.]|uniref:LacI family DNA-binding transcriptional regulator n=1 Tax=Herpetosiphon sp. TaxID=71864 RepID=UPI00257BAF3A|nr:LacI family DNA-binding transcriptional regulator [Herpetosiphon sp.]
MEQLTIRQIAQLANVSRSTVSRVINNHPSVRPEVRQRVLEVIREQDYVPQAAARSLASRRTNVVTLLIPRSSAIIFTDPFFPLIIQGITETCSERDYSVMLSMVTGTQERDFYQRVLRSRMTDGLLMLSSDIDDPVLPLLINDQMPLVLIGEHPYMQPMYTVDVANRAGAVLAVSHLLQLGHRRIGAITGLLQMKTAIDRRDGYKQALLQAGVAIEHSLMIEGEFTQEGGYAAMRQLLSLEQRPSAVFVASDTMALGALRAIYEAGLHAPHDISLIGFDDVPGAAYTTPALTTIHQPIQKLGSTAATMLLDHLEGRPPLQQHFRLSPSLVLRQSCGPRVA